MAGNAAHIPAGWDEVLSTTLHNTRKTLTDNIFNSRPMLEYFLSKGRVRTVSGGYSIVEPLLYAEGQAGPYAEWQQLTITPQAGISAAQFPWRQLYATIAISGLEEAQNNGKEQMISLLEAKIMQAEETLKNRLMEMLWGTQAVPDPTIDVGSIVAIADSTGAIGGINPADAGNGWWAAYEAAVGAVDASGLEAALGAAVRGSSDGGSDRVDAIFTAELVYSFYESTLTPQVRYTDTRTANLGFQNLLYKQVPIYWDAEAPTGVAVGLNSKYVGLVIHSERNFKQSPFSNGLANNMASAHATNGNASTVDARYSLITTYLNTTTRNRRRLFKLTGIAEA